MGRVRKTALRGYQMAWHNQGDVFELAKMAKRLGRNYTQDLADRIKKDASLPIYRIRCIFYCVMVNKILTLLIKD